MNFESFLLHSRLTAGISAAGYSEPTPIQAQAIPHVMQGRDVMGLAQTGTGKTAAFVLPILHRLLQQPGKGVGALVVAPTRELAEQIHQAFEALGMRTGLRSAAVYGGVGMQPQVNALKRAQIVVACPGRLLDHVQRRSVDLSHVRVLVLDEADQMFDMGFMPDIRRIIAHLPRSDRQTLLFSATMPVEIGRLADEVLTHPIRVEVAHDAPVETVSHAFFPVAQHLKTALLLELLGHTATDAVLVFTRTKHRAKQLCGKLAKAGFLSASLQGNLSQSKRQAAMDGFKRGKYRVLVATDIASRGIDVSNVSHVINFDMPATAEIYIHRIGRTGRAKRSGEAYTLITDDDRTMVKAIHRVVGHVERRILSGFDYQTPMPPAHRHNPPASNARRTAGRSAGRSQRRDIRGEFA